MKVHNIRYIEDITGKPISEVSKVEQEIVKKTFGYAANDLGNSLEEFCKIVKDSGAKLMSRKKERKENNRG